MLLLIVIYLIYIGSGLPCYLLGAAWPSVYVEMGVPDSVLGIVSTIMICSMIVANLFSANLLKRFGIGSIIAVCMLIMGITATGYALAGAFVILCVFAVPLGLALGSIDAVLNNFVAVHFKSRHMNWLHCFWGIGATVGPIILASGMTVFGTWRAGYYSVAGIQFALAVLLFLTVRTWKKAPVVAEKPAEPIKVNYAEVFRLKGIRLSLVAFFAYCALEFTVALWGPLYMVMVKGVTEEQAAQWISFVFLGMTLGRLLAGFMTFKLSNLSLIRFGSLLILIGIVIMFISGSEIGYISGFFIMGIGFGPIWPCLVHETPRRFGEAYSQSVVGLQLVSSNVGNALAPLIFGAITPFVGYAMLPFYLLILLIVTVLTIEAQKLNKSLTS